MTKVTAVQGDGVGRKADAVVVGCLEGEAGLLPEARPLNRAHRGALSVPLDCNDFKGKPGETTPIYLPEGTGLERAVLLGLGPEDELDVLTLRGAAGTAGRLARRLGLERVLWLVHPLGGTSGVETAARAVTEGFLLGAYRAPVYRKKGDSEDPLKSVTLLVGKQKDLAPVRNGIRTGQAIANGVRLARDLINQPGNRLTPGKLATSARKLARNRSLSCRVMGKAELNRLNAGGILAVGQGSANPPCLIQLIYKCGRARAPHVCVVGKGITFDTGGISLKPALNMEKMKYDMGGAGAVMGILDAVAKLGLSVDVTGLIASAENMPGSRAYKPGDVITQLNGTTVEVINTDAEGRIVLGDALSYAVRKKPDAIVDLATLTGAATVAVGSHAVAFMANDDDLAERMAEAGRASGEWVWRLPLWKQYRQLLASDVADVKNSGSREAGTIAGGIFLEKFVDGVPWVHLDIAGTAWSDSAKGWRSKGGTGVGVALVTQFLFGFQEASRTA